MKFSEAWLREWVNPQITTQELAHQLTMAGLEVDSVTAVAGVFSGVVVGHVVSCERHPDAEKLSLCKVDVGQGEPLQIVCGAANITADMKVPVATIGGVLPGDFKIKRAKLRGVESFGMICSAKELGLAESSDGILPLPADAPIGQDFRAWMRLDDHSIEVDLTPNRGDCLGLAGIAREVGVINRVPLTPPAMEAVAATINDRFPVSLEAPAACPRYSCRIIRGVDPTAPTPLWMQERLRRSGLRSLGPLVDVTNYVMLELGQPMHAFDLRELNGGIRVRMAAEGERLKLLDGQELTLRADTLVIADRQRAVALAGIMGGEHSGVADDTRDILLESAFFSPLAVAGKARSYGLHTDSSFRFERGVDPQLQLKALERATRLLLDLCGGQPGPVVEVADEGRIDWPPPIRLRRERVGRVLGVQIPDDTLVDILQRLGMTVIPNDGGWQVTAPSARFDMAIERDLIEEIGRIYGYDNIPALHGAASTRMEPRPEAAFDLWRAKQVLVDRDYREAITYSFIAPELNALFESAKPAVPVANPISAEMSAMRTSLWPGLVQAAKYNQARQQSRIRLFESGLRFIADGDDIRQEPMLALLAMGPVAAEQWGLPHREVDFFDLKGDLLALLGLNGAAEQFRFEAAEHPALHPGQCARILRDGLEAGWLGMLHPELARRLDLAGNTLLCEIRLDALAEGRLPAFRPLSKFPSIRRDLAIVVTESIPSQEVLDCVRKNAGEFLQDIWLFDVYNGEKIEPGTKSLAFGLILQTGSGTLTDQEVEEVQLRVLGALRQELKAQLRV